MIRRGDAPSDNDLMGLGVLERHDEVVQRKRVVRVCGCGVWESTRGLSDVRNRWVRSLAGSCYLHYSTVHCTVTSITVVG